MHLTQASQTPYTDKVVWQCWTLPSPVITLWRPASLSVVTAQLICSLTSGAPRRCPVPTSHHLPSVLCISSCLKHQPTKATITSQKSPQKAEVQARMKPERKEDVRTTKEVFPAQANPCCFLQESPEARPRGHPLTALPGPGPEVWNKCQKY